MFCKVECDIFVDLLGLTPKMHMAVFYVLSPVTMYMRHNSNEVSIYLICDGLGVGACVCFAIIYNK